MKDSEFLNWVACRMVLVYGESPNVDFVHRAREVAANIEGHESDLDRYAVSLENMEVLRAQVEVLEAWKAEELAVMNPLMDYARSVCTGPLGCSITEWLVEDHKSQAWEIERLKEGQDSLILVRDDYKSQVNEYRELWAKAAIKANPSVVVGMLRDTLELWLADYEAVASNPDFETFPHVADLAAKTRDALNELARINEPVSAGDERATLSAFTAWGESIGLRPTLQTVGELKAFKAGAEWKARAAPSANHSEQVRQAAKFTLGDRVRKTKGSQWHGTVVGTYSTALTPEGYAVESSTEIGSVQIYPAAALEACE